MAFFNLDDCVYVYREDRMSPAEILGCKAGG